jgi:hypothetical protein
MESRNLKSALEEAFERAMFSFSEKIDERIEEISEGKSSSQEVFDSARKSAAEVFSGFSTVAIRFQIVLLDYLEKNPNSSYSETRRYMSERFSQWELEEGEFEEVKRIFGS